MELLAPAGSLEAVRAAVANGADSVYLGAQRFNARDDGAQLSMDEVAQACALAHQRGVRVYLTLNVLIKSGEMRDALTVLAQAIDAGVDAAIVQDIGLMRAIHAVWPGFELHGSTQMTVHDPDGARLAQALGITRLVLARENTVDDIRSIREAVPGLGLEAFVHGALCISYSGQCLMSGLISERSANRGSCAQACRKEYVLTDSTSGVELDRGFLISARDLAAHDQLAQLSEAGIECLKVEGRKKKPEYVATVTRGYRGWLDRLARGDEAAPAFEEVRPLIQIYSRGFTAGMLTGGRAGRDYITREQPDNRGLELGVVTGHERGALLLDLAAPIEDGDGLGFEPPVGQQGKPTGFAARNVVVRGRTKEGVQVSVLPRERIPAGWRVFRSAAIGLTTSARASWASLEAPTLDRREPVDVRLFGNGGAPLKAIWTWRDEQVITRSAVPLAPAQRQALDDAKLRAQLGRLGETPFVLRDIDRSALAAELFLPVSEINRLRTDAVDELLRRREWAAAAEGADLEVRITRAVVVTSQESVAAAARPRLTAVVMHPDAARAAAAAGATEVVLDPFLRHPVPPVARARDLAAELAELDVPLRLRLPTIVRPPERRLVDRWLDTGLPVQTGHAGMAAALASAGRDVVADYAINCFNPLTAEWLFAQGIGRVVASVELTLDELRELTASWQGSRFDVLVFGRPEGMTIEHCVLSAAKERVPTTCRDLCVKSHPVVELTDPAGYTFPVATDSACRNRLLHSRPIEGSEFLPALWRMGIRGYQLLFNMPDDPVAAVTAGWAGALGSAQGGEVTVPGGVRSRMEHRFTRGHFLNGV